jgi:hypothetical protein
VEEDEGEEGDNKTKSLFSYVIITSDDLGQKGLE